MKLRWAFLVCFMPSLACAGFMVEGTPTVSTDRTSIGRYTPYEERGMASFKQPEGDKKSQQERYANAELMIDMAYRPVSQTGAGEITPLSGFADEVPFNQAMPLILPSGWQLYRDKGLSSRDIPELVSFQGGKPWPDVLGDLGAREGLHFHIDWYQHTVMMSKGRQLTPDYKRIRVIAEPAHPAPAVHLAALGLQAGSAQAVPVTVAPPVKATQALATSAVTPAKPVVTSNAAESAAIPQTSAGRAAADKLPAATEKAVVQKPEPQLPAETTLNILPGTLRDNVIRLSKMNGWEAPDWKIKADYRIDAGYTLKGKDFAEAMAKLLFLHPIEADVNVAQRKVYVLKEAN